MGRDGKGGVVMLTYLTPRQREVVLLIQQGMFARAE